MRCLDLLRQVTKEVGDACSEEELCRRLGKLCRRLVELYRRLLPATSYFSLLLALFHTAGRHTNLRAHMARLD